MKSSIYLFVFLFISTNVFLDIQTISCLTSGGYQMLGDAKKINNRRAMTNKETSEKLYIATLNKLREIGDELEKLIEEI